MIFEIDFNRKEDDKFLIDKLGAYWVPTNSNKYPPFEVLKIDVPDFTRLEEILNIVDKELGSMYSAIINFDPPAIYLDNSI